MYGRVGQVLPLLGDIGGERRDKVGDCKQGEGGHGDKQSEGEHEAGLGCSLMHPRLLQRQRVMLPLTAVQTGRTDLLACSRHTLLAIPDQARREQPVYYTTPQAALNALERYKHTPAAHTASLDSLSTITLQSLMSTRRGRPPLGASASASPSPSPGATASPSWVTATVPAATMGCCSRVNGVTRSCRGEGTTSGNHGEAGAQSQQ